MRFGDDPGHFLRARVRNRHRRIQFDEFAATGAQMTMFRTYGFCQ